MTENMKVSIITVCYNAVSTLQDTINSVLSQDYQNIEYIIVDGGSTDGTVELIRTFKEKIAKFISEPDKGIYDAMNKGINLASGDIVAILNADDFYVNSQVISKVVRAFYESGADIVYGDIIIVHPKDTEKVIRYWKTGEYRPGSFKWGWHPPHPAFFVKRKIYEKYGVFDLDFKRIAADFEIMARFMERYKVKWAYIPEVLVKMRAGGKSAKNIWNIAVANWECYKALKKNGIRVTPLFMILKPMRKLLQTKAF
jgi:glycosyltransferase involved in cell wall biosynthesis